MNLQELIFNVTQYPSFLFVQDPKNISKTIASLPWNCIITTCEDTTILSELFNTDDRNCITKENASDFMKQPLGKKKLTILKINSSIPSDISKKLSYQTNIQDIFSYIQDYISKLGVMVFDSIETNNRIIDDEILLLVNNIHPDSIVSFLSGNINNKDIKELLPLKKATLIESSMLDYFSEIEEDEYDYELASEENHSVEFYVSKKPQSLKKTSIKDFSLYFNLLTKNEISKTQVSPYTIQEYFFQFLKNSAKENEWYGYESHFNFPRDEDEKIYEEVKRKLKNSNNKKPLLIYGQSGAGKTIAINNLAYRIFMEKEYPVIQIKTDKIEFSKRNKFQDITDQNKKFELLQNQLNYLLDLGAKNILLIWDLSIYSSDYINIYLSLFRALTTRGINVVLLCSGYDNGENTSELNNSTYFDAINLSVILRDDDKFQQFNDYLLKNTRYTSSQIAEIINILKKEKTENNLFSIFYHFFEVAQPVLSEGVKDEAINTLDTVIKKCKESETLELTVMELALKKAGLLASKDEHNIKEKRYEDIHELLIISCICSKFSAKLPVNLALRLLDNFDLTLIKNAVKIPFFKYSYNDIGDIFFEVRTPLEANIILQALKINTDLEIDYICKLLEHIECGNNSIGDYEITCAADLLHNIGPNSERRRNYIDFYPKLISQLEQIKNGRILDRRLALAEVNFIREYAVEKHLSNQMDKEDYIRYLQQAIEICRLYDSNLLETDYYCIMLRIEEANSHNRVFGVTHDLHELEDAKQAAEEVMAVTDNQYAYTVWIDSCLYQLQASDTKDGKLLSKLLYFVDNIRTNNYELDYDDKMVSRFTETYKLVGNSVEEKYLDQLINKNNPLGVYIKAIKKIKNSSLDLFDFYKKDNYSSQNIENLKSIIVDILESADYRELTHTSPECLFLLLKLKWVVLTGKSFLKEEKQRISLSADKWKEILDVCEQYENCRTKESPLEKNNVAVMYFEALCLSQLEKYTESFDVITQIREITKVGYYSAKRVYSRHILCDENGKPKEFSGTILKIKGNDIPIKINKFPNIPVHSTRSVLNDIDIEEGKFISDFYIGIGYMGFTAIHTRDNIK